MKAIIFCICACCGSVGFGIERCLYMLNPVWPCQSPILAQEYVCHIRELLPALERVAQQGIPATEPVDSRAAADSAATAITDFRMVISLWSEKLLH